MFTLLWNILPGPKWLRILINVLIGIGLVAVIWFYLYPWVYETYIFDDAPILR